MHSGMADGRRTTTSLALALSLALWAAAPLRSSTDMGTEQQRADGKQLYDKYCAQCHGDAGDGKGHATPRLKPEPRDFTSGKYKFRTTPLRNVMVQPHFFHNGAFSGLEDAIRHHLDVVASANGYDPEVAGLDPDLKIRRGPTQPLLERLDPILATPIDLSPDEFNDLLVFVRDALLDPRAIPGTLCRMTPRSVPSGMPIGVFQDCLH